MKRAAAGQERSRSRGRDQGRESKESRPLPDSSRAPKETKAIDKKPTPPDFSPSSYTSTDEAERKDKKTIEAKDKAERRKPRSLPRERSARRASPEKSQSSSAWLHREIDPNPINFEDPAFKDKIKAEYLRGLEEQKKAKITLEEGPGGKGQSLLPPALLRVSGESVERPEKTSKGKKRRR